MTARHTLTAAAAALVVALPGTASAQEPEPPSASGAEAAIVVDGRDGTLLFSDRPDAERPIASTTKLMTALLTLENAEPGAVFSAPAYHANPAESRINLREGERMTVEDLLEALLLESANDAAAALAVNISGSREAFVEAMNERAEELGLDHTSYANPIGLDEPGNYSSARDLATLTRHLLRNRLFARIVDMPKAVLESGDRPRVVMNRNNLVAEHPWVSGVKTGYTLGAGNVLVGAAERGRGIRVISVVLGEPTESSRDADTAALLSWGLSLFRRARPLERGRVLATADVRYFDDDRVELVARRGVALTVRDGQRVRRRVSAPEEVEGPLAAGERVGSVTVLVDGEQVRRVALVTAAEVPGAGTLRVLLSDVGVPLTLLIALAILVAAVLLILRLRLRIRIVR